MNRLRPNRVRDESARWTLYVLFALFVLRLLIPTGLMLDASAGADSFGLVMCSGHGPLDLSALTSANGTSADDAFKAAAGSDDAHRGTPSADSASSEVCPFSAVGLLAFTTAAILLVFCHFATVVTSWRVRFAVVTIKRLFSAPQGARAPPAFA